MGACTFRIKVEGKTAEQAFRDACNDNWSQGGYTGTIAEKDRFKMVYVPEGKTVEAYMKELLGDKTSIGDKFGPAGCIELSDNQWLFFGVASC